MQVNPVANYIFIIRTQAEYSLVAHTVSVRCILEVPSTGERHGFADVEALLAALGAELIAAHATIIPMDEKEENP